MFLTTRLEDLFEEQDSGFRIPAGAVTVRNGNAQVAADLTQAIARRTGEGLPAETDRAELLSVQVQPTGFQLMFDKGIVEVDVMSDKDGAGEPFMDNIRYFLEIGGVGNHYVVDTGEGMYIPGDGH